MYICTYTDIHAHAEKHVHIHRYTCTHRNMCIYTHMHIYTYTCIHIYICIYTHMHTYTHIHVHINTCTYTPNSLDTSGRWTDRHTQQPCSEGALRRTLSSLSALLIRGGYYYGPETTWLKNVVLKRGVEICVCVSCLYVH